MQVAQRRPGRDWRDRVRLFDNGVTVNAAPRWLSDPQQAAWRAYLRATRLLEHKLDADLRPYGIQLTDYELISLLSEAPDQRLRMAVLADRTVQSRSRVTHTAKRLEERGWVRRERCPEVDGRGVELVLTEAGRAAVEHIAPAHVESVRTHFLDLLDPAALTAIGEAMGAVRDGLDADEQNLADPLRPG